MQKHLQTHEYTFQYNSELSSKKMLNCPDRRNARMQHLKRGSLIIWKIDKSDKASSANLLKEFKRIKPHIF